jgi:hypothetical protein
MAPRKAALAAGPIEIKPAGELPKWKGGGGTR